MNEVRDVWVRWTDGCTEEVRDIYSGRGEGTKRQRGGEGETNSEGVNGQCQFEQGERKRARQS